MRHCFFEASGTVEDDFSVFKEDLKNRIDIVDIVGEYMELKRRGSNFVGLCPFHSEKTPSFQVHRTNQFYHCFGCGKGGDVIGFLMDITGMGFMEAVEQLADRAGIEVPKSSRGSTVTRDEKDRLSACNVAAAEYFYKTLFTDKGKAALEYLTKRGLTEETIRSYRLGFAPEDPTDLIKFVKSKDISPSSLEDVGIVMPARYGNTPYARFGGRVIFPIIDMARRVIGFGGRLLEGDGAKYLNSPDSIIYHKSQVLFGIHQAKDVIKRQRTALVVEGYMDVISLHQAGVLNAIAASGTAFTVEQGRIIARMARDVVLLFDGDRAGLSAAARGADNLLTTDLGITIAVLPEGHDPDSYVGEAGVEALKAVIDDAIDLWEFKLQNLSSGTMNIQERHKLAGEVADSIALIQDDLKRDLYIREMAGRVGVDFNSMEKAVNGRLRRRTARDGRDTPKKEPVGTRNERDLLAYIIQYPNLARHFMEEAGARPFETPVFKTVAEELFHRLVEGLDSSPSSLISGLESSDAKELVAELAMMYSNEETASTLIEDNILKFKRDELQHEIENLSARFKDEQNEEKKREILAHLNELRSQLKSSLGVNKKKKK